MKLLVFSSTGPHVVREVEQEKAFEMMARGKARAATPLTLKMYDGQYRDLTSSPSSK
jgi:hypothetical protein